MKHFVVALASIFLPLGASLVWSQTSHTPVLGVRLQAQCLSGEEVRFRLRNDTEGPITVRTFSSYQNALKNYRIITLRNGVKVYALPSNKDIESLFYWVEKELAAENGKRRFEAVTTSGDSGDYSWIEPGDSISFRVPIEELPAMSELYVKYNFDWELVGKTAFPPSEMEHRARVIVTRKFTDKCAGSLR